MLEVRPGEEMLDTNGARIQAHGGSMLYLDGIFYWYGENKEHTVPGSGIWHWGVRCYASTDLYTWEDQGLIISPELGDTSSPLHPAQLLDRPHIVRHPDSGRFVCWLRVSSRAGRPQALLVLVADSILGPYTKVRLGLRPFGMDAGDFDLVVDPEDGKGYCYFERVHRELICADLTRDLTDVTGYYSTHFPRPRPPFVREAPAHFVRGDSHYLITSGTTWYFPNQSEIASAQTYHGPWTVLGDPHAADPTGTSFRSQVSSVFQHPHWPDLYIALADRWLPNLADDPPKATDLLARETAGDPSAAAELMRYGYGSDPDTSRASYVWLPIRFDGDRPTIEWHDRWRIEDYA